MTRLRIGWVVASMVLCSRAVGQDAALGPARDVGLVDDFEVGRSAAWAHRHGDNVTATVRLGQSLPGVAETLLKAMPRRKNMADREGARNWFALTRNEPMPASLPDQFDGFRVVLGSGGQAQWWISMAVKAADGKSYSRLVTDAIFPSGRMIEHLLPLETFLADGVPLTVDKARTAASIELAFSVPGADLYLDRITVYRRSRQTGWLTFTTSHPANNLFERGEKVHMVFTPGGRIPSEAIGFTYEVTDLGGRRAAAGKRMLTSGGPYRIPAEVPRHGYYEVRAWWTDAMGRRLAADSCIRAEGTMPEGIGTFAVLPSTIAENRAMFARLGRAAFFGLHGDFHGLADRIGLAWRFGYEKWPYLEPTRPDRSSGVAEWARRRMAEPPQPPYALHILPFIGNMTAETPEWARAPEGRNPPYREWDDYLAMVRDSVRVEKHRYPHMSPRLYGGAWEVNLNMPPYSVAAPPYTPDQVAELFRRTRETIRTEDPTALILGPCPSILDMEWFETVFKAGVLRYLDAIETHGYMEGVWDPEENDYPGKIARIKALTRRHAGRVMDIYCTELGHPGILGAQVVARSQAERMVRSAIILKGEGVRVLLPFYGIDYDRLGYWGFLYNLDVDAPEGPWAARRVSPKPMVTAMAACVRLLEGARPLRRLAGLGADVWGYVFQRGDDRITALWKPGPARQVRIPVDAARVEIQDIEGHRLPITPSAGTVTLRASESPLYVIERRRRQ